MCRSGQSPGSHCNPTQQQELGTTSVDVSWAPRHICMRWLLCYPRVTGSHCNLMQQQEFGTVDGGNLAPLFRVPVYLLAKRICSRTPCLTLGGNKMRRCKISVVWPNAQNAAFPDNVKEGVRGQVELLIRKRCKISSTHSMAPCSSYGKCIKVPQICLLRQMGIDNNLGLQPNKHKHICVCTYTDTYAYTYETDCLYVHTYIHTYTCICSYVCMYLSHAIWERERRSGGGPRHCSAGLRWWSFSCIFADRSVPLGRLPWVSKPMKEQTYQDFRFQSFCIYIYIRISVHMCMCMYMYICIYTFVDMYIYIHTCYLHMHMRMFMDMYMYVYCIHAYVYLLDTSMPSGTLVWQGVLRLSFPELRQPIICFTCHWATVLASRFGAHLFWVIVSYDN